MKRFFLALNFLTIIPWGNKRKLTDEDLAKSAVYFPVIGLLLAMILLVSSRMLAELGISGLVAAVITVTLLTILTGGLHLDGLADSCDALFSHKSKERMLEIMRDSHIGAMGVLALILVILLKVILIAQLSFSEIGRGLVLACCVSRYNLVLAAFVSTYPREGGKAKAFLDGVNKNVFYIATGIIFPIAVFSAGIIGILILIVSMGITYVLAKAITAKIDGVTGDNLGAISEIVEIFVLLAVVIFLKSELWLGWHF